MKVHPAPRKRNIAAHYAANRRLPAAAAAGAGGRQKKLRRLPHIFSKVLELPFGADTDVDVHEDADQFMFVVATDDIGADVRAHAIHIHPGVTKVVIRDGGGDGDVVLLPLDDLELDRWRFRLPRCTLPDLAAAACVHGELVVTVPKGGADEDSSDEGEGGDVWGDVNGAIGGGGIGRLVFVQ